MTTYYIIKSNTTEILNTVIADTPEQALLGSPTGTVAVTELEPAHHYPAQPVSFLPPEPLTKLAFLRRFTAEERISIRASLDPVIVDFMALLDLAEEVRLDDPDTLAAVRYLTALGLLTGDREAAVMGEG